MLVLPFENSSRLPKLDWLGEGLAELTLERLAIAGESVFPREEWLAALETLGLPASTRFSRASMLKIGEEIDADWVVFGQYASDGKTLTVTARGLRVNPPALMPSVEESGALEELMDTHARLVWRLLSSIQHDSSIGRQDFIQKLPRLRLDAFEFYVRGLLSTETRKDDQRLHLLHEAARLEPAWDDPAFAIGDSYFARRDCEAALPWLSKVPPAHRRGLEARFEEGVCHLLRNDPARAEAAFANLLDHVAPFGGATRELPEVFNNLGIARERLGKSQDASQAFERATQLDPDDADYWFNLGVTELRKNQAAAAVPALREALRRRPQDARAHALLIAVLERSGHATEAAAEREELVRRGGKPAGVPPFTPEALLQLDRVKMRLDSAALYPVANSAGEAADSGSSLLHHPQHRQLHLTRGKQLLAAGKLEDAQREFTAAIALAPFDPAAHLGLAEVYRRQGRRDDAMSELRAALDAREDALTRISLARLYLEQNRRAEAREELRLALKLDPGNGEARQMLAELDARNAPGEPR